MNCKCAYCNNIYGNKGVPVDLVTIEDFNVFFMYAPDPWTSVGPFMWMCHECKKRIFYHEPVEIMKDGRCNCNAVDPCPLNKLGSSPRCLEIELTRAGCRTTK